MVTKATNNIEDKPFIPLDFQAFTDKRPHAAGEVRNVLRSRISQVTEVPEEIGGDREAREAFLRKRKEEMAYKNALNDLELFDKNPELYTTLFSLKETANGEVHTENREKENERDTDKTRAKICEDQNGNLFLAVEIMKPADVSFQIHDGKLSFDPNGMSPDQLREILAWLDRRGLASFVDMDGLKLENADARTEELFAAVKKEAENETKRGGDEFVTSGAADALTVNQSANDNDTPYEEDRENGETQRGNEASEGNGEGLPFGTLPIQKTDRNKAPANAYDNAVESLTKWMDKNKRRNLSYFITYKSGYTVFTTFDKENPENMEQDGVIDKKTKDVKVRSECKLYVKMDKDGRLEISFSTPNGKPLSDTYADRIMDAYKDAGISRVKFGTMSDANEGSIRAACGRALIVPVGLKLSQTKFDKMIDAAEGKNGKNNPKVIKYRRDLALQFAHQLKQKGINWQDPANKNNVDCRCIRVAIGAYNFSPFRDWWEDFGLRNKYEEFIKNSGSGNRNGAADAIGAAKAVAKLYAAYSDNTDKTLDYLVSDKCKSLTPEEKEKFKEVIRGSEKMQVRDMPPEAAQNLFSFMQQTQAARATRKINEEYEKLVKDEFYKGNAARDAVTPYLTEASTEIDNVKNDLADIGLPPILVMKIGMPKHDFSPIQRRLKAEKEQAKQNNSNIAGNAGNNGQLPSRGYGRGGGESR